VQARLKILTHPALLVVDEIGMSDQPGRRDALLSADDAPLRARVDGADVQQRLEEWGEVFGDDVMAAALIDRLVDHCHIVTIRGNRYRMRQHTDLWQALHIRRSRNRPRTADGGLRQEVAELRLVPSPICQIFNRRKCPSLARR